MAVYHDEIEIEDFEYDEDEETYYYPCPCGDRFQISKVSLSRVSSFPVSEVMIYHTHERIRCFELLEVIMCVNSH